ncbi:MAG: zf-HC2 domain-containing protein [Treponema sp.]|jgi:hypothetical protein|nr:zf-HC2 domain-containing protein [Treponema sp.]
MSICPDMELHSAFLDGEIANPWCDEIKMHIEKCTDCKSSVGRLQSIHDVFVADSASLNLNQSELDASYERLQSRLRYKKVAAKSSASSSDFVRKFIPYAAAAAFLAAVIMPAANIRSQVKQHFNDVALLPVSSTVELIDKTGIAADQNLNVSTFQVADTVRTSVHTQPISLHVSNLTHVGIFKPEFANTNSLPMNIKLTDVSELPLIDSNSQQNVVYPVPAVDFYR